MSHCCLLDGLIGGVKTTIIIDLMELQQQMKRDEIKSNEKLYSIMSWRTKFRSFHRNMKPEFLLMFD